MEETIFQELRRRDIWDVLKDEKGVKKITLQHHVKDIVGNRNWGEFVFDSALSILEGDNRIISFPGDFNRPAFKFYRLLKREDPIWIQKEARIIRQQQQIQNQSASINPPSNAMQDDDGDTTMQVNDERPKDGGVLSEAMRPGVASPVDPDSVIAMEVDHQDEYQTAANTLAAAALRHDDASIATEDAAATPILAAAAAALRHDDSSSIASEDAALRHDDSSSIASEDAAAALRHDDSSSIASEDAAAALIASDHEDDAVVAEQPDEASDLFTTAQGITNSSITTQLEDYYTTMQNDPKFVANEDFGAGNVGIDTTNIPPLASNSSSGHHNTFEDLVFADGRLKIEVFKNEDGTPNVERLVSAHIDVNNNPNLQENQKALLHKAYTKHQQICQQAIDQATWSKTKKKTYRRSGRGRCSGKISMPDLQSLLTADDLLESLAFARENNRRYKVLICKKVKNGVTLDDDEKKFYVSWEKAIRNSQKLRISIIEKIKDGSLQYNDLTAADYITIKHLVLFLSPPSGRTSAAAFDKKWDRQLSKAVSYQLQFGHLHVPRKGHWKPLSMWLVKQRFFKNSVPPSLDQRREVALTELGFVWNPLELKWNRKMISIFKFFDTAYTSDINLGEKKVQGLRIEGYDSDTEVVKIGSDIARLRLRILHQCNLVRDHQPRVDDDHRIRNQHLKNKPPDLNRRQIQDLIANNFCMSMGVSLKFFLLGETICYKFEDETNFI